MLQKIIFLLFAVVVGLPLNTNGQRNIVWVHGLNTDADDWRDFRDQFQGSHQFNSSITRKYTSDEGLVTFAANIILRTG